MRLFIGKTIAGSNTTLLDQNIPAGSARYLRVVRMGSDFTTYTSEDGPAWVLRHTFRQVLNVAKVGVFAANPIGGLAFTSEVDYLQSNLAPISDEDANTIEIEIVGSGSAVLDPDQSSYALGEIVALTPVAGIGSTFLGWSGDLTGSSVPGQLMMNQAMRVTATFSAAAVPGLGPVASTALGALLAGLRMWRTLRRSALMRGRSE